MVLRRRVDCRTKDASRRELYIVEGDSAMGAVKTSRDSEYQAIMPIRGKILNCLKADYARIFKSDVIVDLIFHCLRQTGYRPGPCERGKRAV